jgi:hypothetical protein
VPWGNLDGSSSGGLMLGKLLPPKSSVVAGAVAMVGEETGGKFYFVTADGALQLANLTVSTGKQSGPPAVALLNNVPQLVTTASNNGSIQVLQADVVPVLTSVSTLTDGNGHTWPVTVQVPQDATPLVAFGDFNGARLVTLDLATTITAHGLDINGGPSPVYVAAHCGASNGLFVDEKDKQVAFTFNGSSLSGLTGISAVGGAPVQGPIIVERTGFNPLILFFRPGKAYPLVQGSSGVTSLAATGIALGTTNPTSTPALASVGGVTQLVVPAKDGKLALVTFFQLGSNTPTFDAITLSLGASDLGGAVGVKLVPSDTTPTFMVGDAAGKVWMVRNSAVVSDTTWQLNVGTGRIITNPPAVVALNATERLLVVTSNSGNVGHIQAWKLGSGPFLTTEWPEFQHDSGNTGCIDLGTVQ